jgi:hypothetical protein
MNDEGDWPMLVLRRKLGQQIQIGGGVVFKVLAINGRSVRIGIQSPQAMPIWRAKWTSPQPGPNGPKLPDKRWYPATPSDPA